MAIVHLKKVTLFGSGRRREEILTRLQDFGRVHVVMAEEGTAAGHRELSLLKDVQEAIRCLEQCPKRFEPAKLTTKEDPAAIVERVLTEKNRLTKLQDQRLVIMRQLEMLSPWGQFSLKEISRNTDLKFFFYCLPRKEARRILNGLTHAWTVVSEDNLQRYVVVITRGEQPQLSVEPLLMPEDSHEELLLKLEETDREIDRSYSERIQLTRYLSLLQDFVHVVEDRAQYVSAQLSVDDLKDFFHLTLYVPDRELPELSARALEWRAALVVREPAPDDLPPTLQHNSVPFDTGADVVNVYATPGYREWDPSVSVFIAFAIFYAMIVGDAGYGVLFLLITMWTRGSMKATEIGTRIWRLMLTLSLCTIGYGTLTGGWFGINLPGDFFLKKLAIIDPVAPENMLTMMTLSILIGCLHLILANLISARNCWPLTTALGKLGWIPVIIGGFLYWQLVLLRSWAAETACFGLLGFGFLLIFLFSSESRSPLTRFVDGLLALTKISGAFGDILSYLRLFALGLASSYMAVTFNGLAVDAAHALPAGVGLVVAVFIAVAGHLINFVLCIMGGVIHGLRLNFIEFYNWSLDGDGFLFRPFQRKGVLRWNK